MSAAPLHTLADPVSHRVSRMHVPAAYLLSRWAKKSGKVMCRVVACAKEPSYHSFRPLRASSERDAPGIRATRAFSAISSPFQPRRRVAVGGSLMTPERVPRSRHLGPRLRRRTSCLPRQCGLTVFLMLRRSVPQLRQVTARWVQLGQLARYSLAGKISTCEVVVRLHCESLEGFSRSCSHLEGRAGRSPERSYGRDLLSTAGRWPVECQVAPCRHFNCP